eukprot:m.119754 g.119754  ORF g.119754 m.119754 type:complete len:359 (+) comp14332_c0_seq1:90-1166(+)
MSRETILAATIGAGAGALLTALYFQSRSETPGANEGSENVTREKQSLKGHDTACTVTVGNSEDPPVIKDHETLRDVVKRVLKGAGFGHEEQQLCADHLVEANLHGHDSHGIQMLPLYVAATKTGRIKPGVVPRFQYECDGRMVVMEAFEGDSSGLGQVMGNKGVNALIAQTKKHGLALLSLKQSFHIGRVGTYSEMCNEAGLVSVFFTNVTDHDPFVIPFGGKRARCGTNPLTMGMPNKEQPQGFVLDFATSFLAAGKLQNLCSKGLPAPPGCVLDNKGNPSLDPREPWRSGEDQGGILSFGLHKGSGLMLGIELMVNQFESCYLFIFIVFNQRDLKGWSHYRWWNSCTHTPPTSYYG